MIPKPFLKWAGGKTQLIKEILNIIPFSFSNSDAVNYVEPFVGSGAVFFFLIYRFKNIRNPVINDLNSDLIDLYKDVRDNVTELINVLANLEKEYFSLENMADKEKYYYDKRTQYNTAKNEHLLHSALLIFLNKTCFNGLYRVNSKDEFNVPFGFREKPSICNRDLLTLDSRYLQNVEMISQDFEYTVKYISENTFYYLDPPYKPISNTSSFNSYSKDNFDDSEQVRLANFCKYLDEQHCKFILSNSDPSNFDMENKYFEKLYDTFIIKRVLARRNINSKGALRGEIKEILVLNYSNEKSHILLEKGNLIPNRYFCS